MDRMIITGGSGFVGTNLVEHFHRLGWEVWNYDIAKPRNREELNCWKEIDLLDRNRLMQETKDCKPSVFLHFGARTDLDEKVNIDGYAANIEGVCNVIEAVRATPSIERVIFASSQLVCKIGYSPSDEYDYKPSTLYGESKVLTERIIRAADDIGSIWTVVRPTSLWGPWFDVPYKNFFLTIVRNLYVHPGTIKTLKQWGFIGNTVYQIQRLLEAPKEQIHKKTLYLADYEPIELRDFANRIQKCLGSRSIPTVPTNFMKLVARVGDLFIKFGWEKPPLSTFRFRNIITPEVQNLTPLNAVVGPLPYTIDHGIEITVKWLRENCPGEF